MPRRLLPLALGFLGCTRATTAPPPMIPEPEPRQGEVVIPPAVPSAVSPDASPALPPVPDVDGPLDLRVVYPPAGAIVAAGDSTFVFGSTGSGRASLAINGEPVRVWPNGTWLAWLRLPADSAPRLELAARRGPDSVRVVHVVRRAPRFRPPGRGLWVDTTSFTPRGRVWWPAGEPLPVSVRASENASVRLTLDGGRVISLGAVPDPVAAPEAVRAFDRDTANLGGPMRHDGYTGALVSTGVGPPLGSPFGIAGNGVSSDAVLEVARNGDTLRVRWPLQATLLAAPFPLVELDDDRERRGGTDGITYGRALPGGTYHWFLPTGTRARVVARIGEDVRLRLADRVDAWVAAAEATPLPAGSALGRATVGSVTATPGLDRVTIRVPVEWRVPFQVEEQGDGVTVTLYSAAGDVNWIRHGETTGALREIRWRQRESDIVELTARLTGPLWGYRTRWDGNDLLLELRPRPFIDPARPLRGLTIVVDPGHPPVGSTGPSGLTEAEANLGVARVLEHQLVAEGARVLLTRRDDRPVDLWPRVAFADSVNADLLVSIHNNALPDGINPYFNNGSSVFYFHPRSVPLAEAIQRELGRRLPLRDLGIARGDLALVRGTWMPSVLVEGMFMILPEQEAALRSQAGRKAYADAVRAGIRAFLAAEANVR